MNTSNQPSHITLSQYKKKFLNGKARVKSFTRFLPSISTLFKKLALAGFELKGNYVQCHSCHLRYYNFLESKHPERFHMKNSPRCQYLIKKFGEEFIDNLLKAEKKLDKKIFICNICKIRKIHCFFTPCRHAVACNLCMEKIDQTCPYCHITIESTHKIYYS